MKNMCLDDHLQTRELRPILRERRDIVAAQLGSTHSLHALSYRTSIGPCTSVRSYCASFKFRLHKNKAGPVKTCKVGAAGGEGGGRGGQAVNGGFYGYG